MNGAYYNEFDGAKAAWLRELIARNLIAPGDVDERSIVDVQPSDLAGYRQCHFFAGIGVWSYALRLAGWHDDAEVWTGSCPCQPFSSAGRGLGVADARHLWPQFSRLIRECAPPVVFGEQVGGKAGRAWLDLVYDDLEADDYAVGAGEFPACSVGAPHIRQRLYWVADASNERRERRGPSVARIENGSGESARSGDACGLGHAGRECDESRRETGNVGRAPSAQQGEARQREWRGNAVANAGANGAERLEYSDSTGKHASILGSESGWFAQDCAEVGGPGPVNGFWRNADWLPCRDDKWRPVESGTFPLAHGAPERVGRLRGYGDAIVASQAAMWIAACREAMMGSRA